MNIRDFEYVVAVDALRHFGLAAEACHVSQPTLSGQVRKLEEHLGVKIFERTKRSVRTTDDGARIVEGAKVVLAAVGGVEDMAAAMTDPFAGALRLGVIPTIAPYLMPGLIPSLARSLPKVQLKMKETFTAQIEDLLLAGDLDAAIIATQPEAPQLTAIPLYEEPFWIAMPTGHPLSLDEEIDLAGLGGERLLLLSEENCLRDQVLRVWREAKPGETAVSSEETSLTTVLALVGGGFGITLVPAMSLMGPWVTDAGIVVRKERSGQAARQVRLVTRKSYPRAALIERLADIIAAIVPDTVIPERR